MIVLLNDIGNQLIKASIITTLARLSIDRLIQTKRHKELLSKFDKLSENIESSKKEITNETSILSKTFLGNN